MSTIRIDTVRCLRPQDVVGSDESRLYIAGQLVWDGKMERGESLSPNVSRTFTNSVLVELKEQNNNKSEKSLGRWTVNATPTPNGNPPLTATSSGYHYEVYFDVL
jgi:hypothetical protein